MNKCHLGASCCSVHPTVDYDPPVQAQYPLPEYRQPCRDPECYLAYACEYTHDLDYYATPVRYCLSMCLRIVFHKIFPVSLTESKKQAKVLRLLHECLIKLTTSAGPKIVQPFLPR